MAGRHRNEMHPPFAETINLRNLLVAGIKATEAGGREVVQVRKSVELGEKSKGLTREGAKEMVTLGDIKSHWAIVNGLIATFPGLQIISEETHQAAGEDANVNQQEIKSFQAKDLIVKTNDLKILPRDIEVPLSDVAVWIDPLDATQEYTENDPSLLKYVTTMMCVALSGKPIIGIIHAPFENKTYWGWAGKGVSLSVKEIERSKAVETRNSETTIIVSRSHSGPVDTFLKTTIGQDIEIIHAGGAGYKAVEVMKGHADAYVHRTLIKKWDVCAPNALLDSFGGKMTTLDGHSISYAHLESEIVEGGILAAASYSEHDDFLAKLKSTL